MADLLEIGTWRLAASHLFLILLLAMSFALKLGRGREFTVASVRMTLQLVLAGYLLDLIFNQRHLLVSLSILLLMQIFALATVMGALKGR